MLFVGKVAERVRILYDFMIGESAEWPVCLFVSGFFVLGVI